MYIAALMGFRLIIVRPADGSFVPKLVVGNKLYKYQIIF